MERRIEKRQLANIIVLFLIVQFGGLLFAFYTIPPSQISVLVAPPTAASTVQGATYALYLAVYIVIAALVLLILFRKYKGSLLFKLLEAYAVGVPTFFLALYLTGDIFPYATLTEGIAVSAAAGVALVLAKNRWPKLRNTATVIASIGIGVVIGFNGFVLAYLILAVIAIYDYVAVFITKHMQVMARAMAERNLAFLIGSSDVEVTPGSFLSGRERNEARKQLRKSKINDPVIREMVKEGAYPSMSQVALGGGDLALPLMLAVGVYISFSSVFIASLVIVGAAAGLLATMSLLERYKVPLPAIPPLFAFMNVALAVAFIATGTTNLLTALFFIIVSALTMEIILVTLRRNEANAKKEKRN